LLTATAARKKKKIIVGYHPTLTQPRHLKGAGKSSKEKRKQRDKSQKREQSHETRSSSLKKVAILMNEKTLFFVRNCHSNKCRKLSNAREIQSKVAAVVYCSNSTQYIIFFSLL
jgi:hypothetical protein